MRKQEFQIWTVNGAKTHRGHIYEYRDYFFGVDGRTGDYHVTELTTGCALPLRINKLSDVAQDLSAWVDSHLNVLEKAVSGNRKRFKPDYDEYEAILKAVWEH